MFSQATISFKISNFLICFCCCDLSCPILEKDTFIENLYIVLCCVLLNSVLFFNFVCFDTIALNSCWVYFSFHIYTYKLINDCMFMLCDKMAVNKNNISVIFYS